MIVSPASDLFRCLADPTRRAIFERLCQDGERPVTAITGDAGVSQPAVSKHLGVLKSVGLVSDRQAGRQTYYSPCPAALGALTDWTREMSGFWAARMDRLDDLLNRMDQ